MVYRIFTEKKTQFANKANALLKDINSFLQISSVKTVRIIHCYDVENIDKDLFDACKYTVFAEIQTDNVYYNIPEDEAKKFVVSFLPGQFDQRADSCAQCIQLTGECDRPIIKSSELYCFYGDISKDELEQIKKYVINPVESGEIKIDKPITLKTEYKKPEDIINIDGFIDFNTQQLEEFIKDYSLAMDLADISLCRDYFKKKKRNPSETEIRMLDTYWSDHCRHTTFLTHISDVKFEQEDAQKSFENYMNIRKKLGIQKPVTLMNMATIAVKYLKSIGKLNDLDESEEINACTIKINVDTDNGKQDYLLLFKNETHNHPTEIEPFGGAATCIGGAIRDPLSGRSYVYQAMRVSGAGDPLKPINDTMSGKLPQHKLVTTAANGYSSYGNQIGLATGIVDEIYHDGYTAKHLEIGAVIGAVPQKNVRREEPQPNDVVILLGGKTGRDGCGGATGSSKAHNLQSLEQCGAEVQKGNAPEERKLQRLFRNPKASLLIKRCNDFGAGGVSVAIGELADGLKINLDMVSKKYEGLNGTELAISESQERMAVVLSPEDEETFINLANEENLEAKRVAIVTEEKSLVMLWRGKQIVNIDREFLNSNGADKNTQAFVSKAKMPENAGLDIDMKRIAADLNICDKRGLAERFDSTIGAGTVLMPFGGKYQLTPIQSMVAKIPLEEGETSTVSAMSYACNPYLTEKSPYHGAYCAVIESIAKLVASGSKWRNAHLTFQEYFERMSDEKSWGKPIAAMLGALQAQVDLGIAAIGGKDSMSGSFEDIKVPPTLCSFAVSVSDEKYIISPEFKSNNSTLRFLEPKKDKNGLPNAKSLIEVLDKVEVLIQNGKVKSAYTITYGGIAEAVLKMSIGNKIGFIIDSDFEESKLYNYNYGSFILETDEEVGCVLGRTSEEFKIITDKEYLGEELLDNYSSKLENVYPLKSKFEETKIETYNYNNNVASKSKNSNLKPRVLIPVFPGTNCEYDSVKAFEKAGAICEIQVIRNLRSSDVTASVTAFANSLKKSQILFIPGGFSGGDEPDGSGKFITAFLRNPRISEQISDMLENRDGLIGGICNGFQALIKLGLIPYGKITNPTEDAPTLSYNTINRHQSKMVNIRITSNKSPWLSKTKIGDLYCNPVSHGEGRIIASKEVIADLAKNGQIVTQYVDFNGKASMAIQYNPNGSIDAVEGICSPDGRIFGKMGHSERVGKGLYKNIKGNFDIKMFESAVEYFK